MKKTAIIFVLIILSIFFIQKSFVFAEDKTFNVVYTNAVMVDCIDTDKYIEYRKSVQKYYLKKNAREIDEDFTQYMTPACLPYAKYIKDFDKKAQNHYINVLKKEDLPLSVHFRVKVNNKGEIESKYNVYCHSYENFDIINAENEECKRVLKIADDIKLQKFDKTMEYNYLIFDTNFLNFKSDTKPPKVISSMPVGFGNNEGIVENSTENNSENGNKNSNESNNENNSENSIGNGVENGGDKKIIKKTEVLPKATPVPIKTFETTPPEYLKKYYERLFYRQGI